MIPATILHEAEVEIWEALHYYESKSPGLGTDFVREVESGLASIRMAPKLWPVREDGTRRYLLHRFPYLLVYLYLDDHVWVMAVAHCRRRPGYWSQRIEKADPKRDGET